MSSGPVFQSLPWCEARRRSHGEEFEIWDLGEGWQLPVLKTSGLWGTVVRAAGSGLGDYQDARQRPTTDSTPASPTTAALRPKLTLLLAQNRADVFFVERVPERWPGRAVSPLQSLPRFPFWEQSHHLTLDSSFDAIYERQVPKKVRADTLRQLRRLEEKGPVQMIVAENFEQAMPILKQMMDWKNDQYRQLQIPSIFAVPENRQFYEDLTRQLNAAPTGPRVHVSALQWQGQFISVHWGLIDEGRFYYMLPAYDHGEVRKLSPGRIHLMELIRWACDQRLQIFDFTVGDEGYKTLWCNQTLPLWQCYQTRTLRGQLFIWKERLRMTLRRSAWISALVFKWRRRRQLEGAE